MNLTDLNNNFSITGVFEEHMPAVVALIDQNDSTPRDACVACET